MLQLRQLTEYLWLVVKGPQGSFATIPEEDSSLIEKLHVGQVVISTYGEAIAMYIEKFEITD